VIIDIIQEFLKVATVYAHRDAVIDRNGTISYSELIERITGIAHVLHSRGSGTIALSFHSKAQLVVAMMAVACSGRGVLLIDPDLPMERKQRIIKIGLINTLISDHETGLKVSSKNTWNLATLEAIVPESVNLPELDLTRQLYLVFTSGSTGEPKGISMSAGAFSYLINWQLKNLQPASELRIAQGAPVSFDVFYQEVFTALCSGAALVMMPKGVRRDPAKLAEWYAEQHITTAFLPPALLNLVARYDAVDSLLDVFAAGDQLLVSNDIRQWFARMPNCRLHNQYGPAESHVVTQLTMSGPPEDWPDLPSLGMPLPFVKIELRPTEATVSNDVNVGEICICGPCLADGYVGLAELTAEKFRPHVSGGRIYTTGDIGRLLPSGDIAYLGRVDGQLQINGHRIEVGEVEACILSHGSVLECAVGGKTDAEGNDILVAYIVRLKAIAAEVSSVLPVRISDSDLNTHLAAHLPEYALPNVWVAVDMLPKSRNGKIARSELPPIPSVRPHMLTPFKAPVTETEKQIASIWCEVLSLDRVGTDDGFFELGGTSLRLTILQSKIENIFGISLPIQHMVQFPTVRSLAAYLDSDDASFSGESTVSYSGSANDPDEIAIVGMACRFPGANNHQAFWNNILNGVDSITRKNSPAGTDRVYAAGLLENIEDFDANYFGISPREAALMDPQQRIFLECCVSALEDSGYPPINLDCSVGVFAGGAPSTYLWNRIKNNNSVRDDRSFLDKFVELETLMANDKDFLPLITAYKLNLKGPALNINAACATSLFAVHFACRSILSGDCDMALAGAINIQVPQMENYIYEPGLIYSSDGFCRAFDDRADGTVFGAGAGVIVMKRLKDAIRDGDDIYATILGSAVTNDGSNKLAMAAPSVDGQANAIRRALQIAGITGNDISYIEAHGTGTQIGDPVEISALKKAFATDRRQFCAIGSVKPNIGHLGWAAGIAGLIKAVHVVNHGLLPASIHYQSPNKNIDFERSPFFVNTECSSWKTEKRRVAGVSAFGLGGANAHVIIAAHDMTRKASENDDHFRILPLSARSKQAVGRLTEALWNDMKNSDTCIDDYAFTLAHGRSHHEFRTAVVVDSKADAVKQLRLILERDTSVPVMADMKNAALFTGQSRPDKAVFEYFYQSQPAFTSAVNSFSDLFKQDFGTDIPGLFTIYGDKEDFPIAVIQPLIYACQIAIWRFWTTVGIHFDAVVGHSLGEFAAACCAGIVDEKTGYLLTRERGRLLQTLPETGAMVAVFADAQQTSELLAKYNSKVTIAAYNSDFNTTIAGEKNEITWVCNRFLRDGVETRFLPISRAGHCRLMDPVTDDFHAFCQGIHFSQPALMFYSTLTGGQETASQLDAAYWRDQLRRPVRFQNAMLALKRDGFNTFVEIGLINSLSILGQQVLQDGDLVWVASANTKDRASIVVAQGIAELYRRGADINWHVVTTQGQRTHLPTYAFERKLYSYKPKHRMPLDIQTKAPHLEWHNWLYERSWVSLETDKNNYDKDMKTYWIVIDDGSLFSTALASALETVETTVTCTSSDALDKALSELPETRTIQNSYVVVPLLNLQTDPYEHLKSALALLQSFITQAVGVSVILITENTQSLWTENETLRIFDSGIWAMARSVRLEHPDLRLSCIDIPLGDAKHAISVARLLRHRPAESELALNRDVWWRPELRCINFDRTEPSNLNFFPKTFLILGASSELAQLVSATLIFQGVKTLILASRSIYRQDISVLEKKTRQAGAVLERHELDIGNEVEIEDLVRNLVDRFGDDIGICQCAGVVRDRNFTEMSWDDFEVTLTPKVDGTLNVCRAFKRADAKIPLLILFSSATALLGNFGQANHAAANGILDALAASPPPNVIHALTINWGPWTEAGHLKKRPDLIQHLLSCGMGAIPNDKALEAFRYALNSGRKQVAVLPNDWTKYLQANPICHRSFLSAITIAKSEERTDAPKDNCMTDIDARGVITSAVSEILEIAMEEVETEVSLQNYGMTSLSAIQIRNYIQAMIDIPLPAYFCLQYNTMEKMVTAIEEMMPERHDVRASCAFLPSAVRQSDLIMSMQLNRWLSLITKQKYGHRVVPIIYKDMLDIASLRKALGKVVVRHDLLRCYYPDNQPVLVAVKDVLRDETNMFHDVSDLSYAEACGAVAELVAGLFKSVPDPRKSLPWDLICIRLEANKFALLLSLQHIEFDGTSITTFVSELTYYYEAYRNRIEPEELSQPISYFSYAQTQRNYRHAEIDMDRAFFEGIYSHVARTTKLKGHPGFETTTALPAKRLTLETPACDLQIFQAAASALGVSEFSIVLAAYSRLISAISGEDCVIISVISSGRADYRYRTTIGPFTSPNPIPVFVSSDDIGLIRQCNAMSSAITSRSQYPVTDLIDHCPIFKGFPQDTYFTDTCINFTNYRKPDGKCGAPKVLEVLGPIDTPYFETVNFGELKRIPGLHLVANTSRGIFDANFWYHVDRFTECEVKEWAKIFSLEIQKIIGIAVQQGETP